MVGTLRSQIGTAVILAFLLTSCGNPEPDIEQHSSSHSLKELCDFPLHFFQENFNVQEIETNVIATKPIESPIHFGNGCSYYAISDTRRVGLGTSSVWWNGSDGTMSTVKGEPSSHVQIGDSSVAVYINEIPAYRDPETARPSYTLNVAIGDWAGELTFERGNDSAARSGAETLVRMVQALKA